ncbi:hypothetical protein ZHAS_00017643 [Anopheles sinensis]|uniref:Uncharacterized protein n=1 Tax=Anopheles sinensis TaxID=74873 RepID=A0A084WHD3_ANOSI|nr:hypothetical protein ZHAS_00017643 [Anopheles sinensis]
MKGAGGGYGGWPTDPRCQTADRQHIAAADKAASQLKTLSNPTGPGQEGGKSRDRECRSSPHAEAVRWGMPDLHSTAVDTCEL